ncbi:MAG TPA: zf-HC2 domain-containing protein [Vicinamibacterales bacterium]|nr:zf-HC2 domain-containing protein [Vicinamibacterales bacterium]
MSPQSPECRAILSNISAYLDGELDATACAAIEAHCAGCPECAPIVNGLRRTIGLCQNAGTAPLPEDVRARAAESIRKLLDRQK